MKIEFDTKQLDGEDSLTIVSALIHREQFVVCDDERCLYQVTSMGIEKGFSGYETVCLYIKKTKDKIIEEIPYDNRKEKNMKEVLRKTPLHNNKKIKTNVKNK